jgi:hypothetical protein
LGQYHHPKPLLALCFTCSTILRYTYDDLPNVVRNSVNHIQSLLDSLFESKHIVEDWSVSIFVVLGGSNGLQTGLLSILVADLVWDWKEEAAVGSSVGGDTNWGGDVSVDGNVLAGLGRKSKVDSWVWVCSVTLRGIEVLDEGREGVQLGRGSVPRSPNVSTKTVAITRSNRSIPSDQDLLWVCLEMQRKHLLVVVHINLYLPRH